MSNIEELFRDRCDTGERFCFDELFRDLELIKHPRFLDSERYGKIENFFVITGVDHEELNPEEFSWDL